MLQIAFIRQNPELVKQKLGVKNFRQLNLVDEIIALDEEVKGLKKNTEDAQMQINAASNQIQKLIKNGQKEEIDKIRDKVTLLKVTLSKEKADLEQKGKSLEEKLLMLPNLPHSSVPPVKRRKKMKCKGRWNQAKLYMKVHYLIGNLPKNMTLLILNWAIK